jgi:serine/threonine-protein kinase HipA
MPYDAGGIFVLTPLYDVLSAWPIIGSGKNQLPIEKAKLAMAVRGEGVHYRMSEIQPRHWQILAERSGIPDMWNRMQIHVESVDEAIVKVESGLPREFPAQVFAAIRDGLRRQARSFQASTRKR